MLRGKGNKWMRVYKMYHMFHGYGPIATNTGEVIDEIKCELEESGEDQEHGYTRDNLPELKKALETLPVEGDINDATTISHFGPYRIHAAEMTKEEYDNLPEFDGY